MAHRQLLERILGVLVADERIRAVWLWGGFARDEGDAWSDLDVHAVVADDAYPELVAHWDELSDRMSHTILKRLLRFGGTTVLSAVTPDWLRFDVTLEPLSDLGRPIQSPRLLLFDRDGIGDRLGQVAPEHPTGADALRSLVEDFYRVLGLLPVVIGRGELLAGVEGAMLLRRTLIDLMLAESGFGRRGALRLNQLLSSEQRSTLEQLPPFAPTRASVMEARVACARAFRPIARSLLRSRGVAYPDELDAATRAHLRRALDILL